MEQVTNASSSTRSNGFPVRMLPTPLGDRPYYSEPFPTLCSTLVAATVSQSNALEPAQSPSIAPPHYEPGQDCLEADL